jgi:hypothetical protein
VARWPSTVFSVRNSVSAISRLLRPSAARRATRRCAAVSASTPVSAARRGLAPVLTSSVRACWDAYARVYRRYMAAEILLTAVVLVPIFAMATKPI